MKTKIINRKNNVQAREIDDTLSLANNQKWFIRKITKFYNLAIINSTWLTDEKITQFWKSFMDFKN